MATKSKHKRGENIIALNKKASHDYFFEQRFEAGMVLEGWEVKSLRAGRVQLRDSYVVVKQGEVWLLGLLITPLPTVASHSQPDPQRTRKLLLNLKEINQLRDVGKRDGYTIVPVNLHWHKNRAKVQIAIARGKKTYDKRETIKRREWEREKHRILRKKH